jgi:hypothetical protein
MDIKKSNKSKMSDDLKIELTRCLALLECPKEKWRGWEGIPFVFPLYEGKLMDGEIINEN